MKPEDRYTVVKPDEVKMDRLTLKPEDRYTVVKPDEVKMDR